MSRRGAHDDHRDDHDDDDADGDEGGIRGRERAERDVADRYARSEHCQLISIIHILVRDEAMAEYDAEKKHSRDMDVDKDEYEHVIPFLGFMIHDLVFLLVL